MKGLFSVLRIASLVLAFRIIDGGDWAVCLVALVWGLTSYFEN